MVDSTRFFNTISHPGIISYSRKKVREESDYGVMTNRNNVSYKETFNDAANNITKVLINCVHNNCFNCGGTMGEGEGV